MENRNKFKLDQTLEKKNNAIRRSQSFRVNKNGEYGESGNFSKIRDIFERNQNVSVKNNPQKDSSIVKELSLRIESLKSSKSDKVEIINKESSTDGIKLGKPSVPKKNFTLPPKSAPVVKKTVFFPTKESSFDESREANVLSDDDKYEEINEQPSNDVSTENVYESIYDDIYVPVEYDQIDSNRLSIEETQENEKRQSKIRHLITELIATEMIYIEKLNHMITDYMPMIERCEQCTDEMTKENVFINLEDIYRFHTKTLFPDMCRFSNDTKRLVDLFVENSKSFEMYIEFYKNHPNSNRIVTENENHIKAMQESFGRDLGLTSFLLQPVQRLPRYKLLMDNLLSCYNKTLTTLDEESTAIVERIDLARGCIDNVLKVAETVIALSNIVGFPLEDFFKKNHETVVVPLKWQDLIFYHGNKELLLERKFKVTLNPTGKTSNMHCFLFDKMIMFTTITKVEGRMDKFHYSDTIELTKLGITSSKESNYLEVWYENIHNRRYKMEASSHIVKEWTECINKLLWGYANEIKEKYKTSTGRMSY